MGCRQDVEQFIGEMAITARAMNVHNEFALAHIRNDWRQGRLARMKIVHRIAVNVYVFSWHTPLSEKSCHLTSRVARLVKRSGFGV